MTPTDISVVIPTLNEQESIATCVQSALAAGAKEIIVADGGSEDDTKQCAQQAGASQIIQSPPGRGTQLNAGARHANGNTLLFLHADNWLGASCLQQICDCSDVIWGGFYQRIDSKQQRYRWLERGNAARVKWRGYPFGDQAIFVRRSVFEQQGGFPDSPLMEDVVFSQQMRRIAWPVLLPGPVTISSRRWEQNGVFRQTLRNWKIQIAHKLGVSPERLAKWY